MSTHDLTTAQQFELEQMRRASEQMSKEQALDLLVQAKRLLMIKTNVLLSLQNHGHCKSSRQSSPLSGDYQA